MSTNVPIISVTTDSRRRSRYEHHSSSTSSDSDDSSCNDMDYNQNIGGLTDVEDFDSYADRERPRSRKSSQNNLNIPNAASHTQGDVTDVEDYNDSEAEEDEKMAVYPDLKLSLQEFLQHDFQEHLSTTNGVRETVEHKSGNFLHAQNLNNMYDYLTDCEDFNTDSEIENNYEKSACIDLKNATVDQGNVNIADSTLKADHDEDSEYDIDDLSVVSDISDMSAALCEGVDKEQQGMSEDEVLELSSNEEIYQISSSDSDSGTNISEEDLLSSASMPPIDVTFIHNAKRPTLNNNALKNFASPEGGLCNKMFLKVEGNKKAEVLTDTERFDDSVAENTDDDSFDDDDDNEQPIPQAVILAIGDDGGCITECEDLVCDDVSEAAISSHMSALSVDHNAIPLPHREIVTLQEDKFGDTITSVMPMDKEFQFGIYAIRKDECLTDTEEYSSTDDPDLQVPLANLPSRSPSPSPLVESDVTIANERLKPQQSKRLEIISNVESVTDVEEIYMAGTNCRKKKFKSRAVTKSKSKLLETPKSNSRENGGNTDIEDMDLSDTGLLAPARCVNKNETSCASIHFQSEKVTDVEDMTADDISSVSETELPNIDVHTTNLKDYETSSQNAVLTLETGSKLNSHRKLNNFKLLAESYPSINQNLQQQHTDVEDIQLPSDAEECININEAPNTCVCNELSEMLSESCTTVHEKCSNSFNVDAEKLHIKGMLRESHTDTEYVESDESTARGSK